MVGINDENSFLMAFAAEINFLRLAGHAKMTEKPWLRTDDGNGDIAKFGADPIGAGGFG